MLPSKIQVIHLVKINIIKLMIVVLPFTSLSSSAENITQLTPLSFGTIALRDNNSTYKYTISFAGDVNVDSAFIIINPGHPAEYLLSEFPANQQLNISILVPETETMLSGAIDPTTSQFTISNQHTFAPIVTTNQLGEAIINIGGTLTTSGSGFYKDATYFNTMTVIVSY